MDRPLFEPNKNPKDGNTRSSINNKQPQQPPDLNAWLDDESNTLQDDKSSVAENPTDVDPMVPKMMFYTRVINLALSICMIVASLLSLLTTTSATTGVIACYVTAFACLLCCFETHIKQVSKVIAANFGFLYNCKSRAVFMVFIGTLMFSFSLFGMLVGALMLVNAAFNIYVIFKYPGYDDAQRKDAQAELSEYLKSNPAFTKQIVAAGVQVTTDLVTNHPDAVKQGTDAYIRQNRV